MPVSARRKLARSAAPPLRVSPRQVIAFRLNRLGLARAAKDLLHATGPVGLPDFPPGAALSALTPRLIAPASPTALDDAFEARSLVRLRAMRGAPVVVPVEEYELFANGMLPPDEPSMRAFVGVAMNSVKAAKLSAEDAVDLVTRHATKALATGPLDRDGLHARLRESLPQGLLPYCRPCDSHHVHPSLLYAVALKGRFVLFPREEGPHLLWRFDRWLPAGKGVRKRTSVAVADPAVELLRRFLSAYGPATQTEFAAWAGTGGGQPRAVWSRLSDQLIPVELQSERRKAAVHFALRDDASELRSGDQVRAEPAVRLLTPGDPLLQLRDRDTLVPDPAMQKVIWKNLSPSGVVLVGPEVAAIVRLQKKKEVLHLTINSVRRFDRSVRAEVEEAAERLAKSRACSEVKLAWQ